MLRQGLNVTAGLAMLSLAGCTRTTDLGGLKGVELIADVAPFGPLTGGVELSVQVKHDEVLAPFCPLLTDDVKVSVDGVPVPLVNDGMTSVGCWWPQFILSREDFPPASAATKVVVEDASTRLTGVFGSLLSPRTVSLVSPGRPVVHAGDRVVLETSPTGETVDSDRVWMEPGASNDECMHAGTGLGGVDATRTGDRWEFEMPATGSLPPKVCFCVGGIVEPEVLGCAGTRRCFATASRWIECVPVNLER